MKGLHSQKLTWTRVGGFQGLCEFSVGYRIPILRELDRVSQGSGRAAIEEHLIQLSVSSSTIWEISQNGKLRKKES